jgi:hypothetical protein
MNSKSNVESFPLTSIIDFVNTITFDDCTFFDFTAESPHSKPQTSDVLPLPRGGDFLHLLDVISAPVKISGGIHYWVVGKIVNFGRYMVTIEDANGLLHYTTLETVEAHAELIAKAIVTEGIVRTEKEWIDYVEKSVAA